MSSTGGSSKQGGRTRNRCLPTTPPTTNTALLHDEEGVQHHEFFRELHQRPSTNAYEASDLGRSIRDGILALDLEGRPMKIQDMTTEQIAQNVEHLEPLIRPYGCGPVAPANWLVLRTYQKIIELRDEIRFDEMGLATGDRTMKRCYQQALRDIARYNAASSQLRARADDAGLAGIAVNETTRGNNAVLVGKLRSPAAAIEHAFSYLLDKHWHRYLLPFGCFFYEKPGQESLGWTEWRAYMACSKSNPNAIINPFSVTAADVLYLCNTVGYLKRFTFVVATIIWAKRQGVNVLRHRRKGTDPGYRLFVTLEKHLHLFGSLYLHRKVLEMNNQVVGGNWTEMIAVLNLLEADCHKEFGVQPHSLDRDLDNMVVESVKGNANLLASVFPKAAKISDKSK